MVSVSVDLNLTSNVSSSPSYLVPRLYYKSSMVRGSHTVLREITVEIDGLISMAIIAMVAFLTVYRSFA